MCCSEYMCFSEDHLFVCVSGRSDASIISYSTDSFEEVARYTEEELDRCYCVLNGPNGLVYAIACYDDPYEVEQEGVPSRAIVALDAVTLERRLHFGRGVFGIKVAAIAVVGDELYAVDSRGLCIRVFSLAGVYLREIKGDWREPCHLLHHGGRLYLDERRGEDEDWHGAHEEDPQTWSADRKAAGKRIFVLTPEGETLQVWNAERTIWGMYIFGRKLLVKVGDQCAVHALIALKGI